MRSHKPRLCCLCSFIFLDIHQLALASGVVPELDYRFWRWGIHFHADQCRSLIDFKHWWRLGIPSKIMKSLCFVIATGIIHLAKRSLELSCLSIISGTWKHHFGELLKLEIQEDFCMCLHQGNKNVIKKNLCKALIILPFQVCRATTNNCSLYDGGAAHAPIFCILTCHLRSALFRG